MEISPPLRRVLAFPMVFVGGFCALAWELLWQTQLTLATGSSARATALTLFCFSLGLALGSRAAATDRGVGERFLRRPFAAYGLLEILIGLSGLLLPHAFRVFGTLDTMLYRGVPGLEALWQLALAFLVLVIPTMAMGASIPVLTRVARCSGLSMASLYAANTAGACLGILAAVFSLMPEYGMSGTGLRLALGNFAVGVAGLALRGVLSSADTGDASRAASAAEPPRVLVAVFVTGFATFALEVIWFRALKAAYWNTAQTFGVILFAVLLALALASAIAAKMRLSSSALGRFFALAGVLTLIATPLIERIDLWSSARQNHFLLHKVLTTLLVLGPPFLALGVILPLILGRLNDSSRNGRLYALNTVGSLCGTLSALWLALPFLGFVRSAWVVGGILVIASMLWTRARLLPAVAGALALCFAISLSTGVGVKRVIGAVHYDANHEVVASYEGPDVTASVVRLPLFGNLSTLLIDGFAASTEHRLADAAAWMAHLPMLLHPHPERALVICFGTGNTLNTIRREGAQAMDMVEINPRVFAFADLFPINEGVLKDPHVRPIIMDGRAWLRRTEDLYDVITLDPMPPSHTGMNALYSEEFYRAMRSRLRPGGIATQWFPIHLLSGENARSIARAFHEVFPRSMLWMHPDPSFSHGILIGVNDDSAALDLQSISFARRPIARSLTEDQVKNAFVLDSEGLARLGGDRDPVTDDNQLLSYRHYHDILLEGVRTSTEVYQDLAPYRSAPATPAS